MEREFDAWMGGHFLEERPVAVAESLLKDTRKIPHRLMVVDAEKKNELRHAQDSFFLA